MTSDTLIDYWFSAAIRKHWFASTPALDAEIKEKFEPYWQAAMQGKLDDWQQSAEGCLALCIIFDQLPLNMYRGEARSFASERQAVAITKKAIDLGFVEQLDKKQVAFIFMPLMHSESIVEQDLAVACFEKYQLNDNVRFAKHHREIIRRFSRFPHRNKILGRKSSKAELEYLQSPGAFTG